MVEHQMPLDRPFGAAVRRPIVHRQAQVDHGRVEAEKERVLSYASVRLTAKDALKQIALDTLDKLGWTPSDEVVEISSSQADNLRVDRPLGQSGRFGPSGDLA
jgi:hypothetical protein